MPLLEASARGTRPAWHAPVLPVSVQLAPKPPSGLEPLAVHYVQEEKH